MRSEIFDLPEVKEVQERNKRLYEELRNLTGMSIENPDDVASLYATLVAEVCKKRNLRYTKKSLNKLLHFVYSISGTRPFQRNFIEFKESMGLKLPDWTEKYYPEPLEQLTIYSLSLNTYNDELRRLKGGPLVKKISDNMIAKKEGKLTPKDRKMFMYIGHDSTIATLLDTMGVWDKQMPVYNIMAMIELHEDENGYNVRMFLKNSTEHSPHPLTLPGCSTVCPLDEFVELLQPMFFESREEESKVCEDGIAPPAPAP